MTSTSTPINIINDNVDYDYVNYYVNDYVMNTQPILQQQKSDIVTNPFISDQQKEIELTDLQNNANKIVSEQYNRNITTSIHNLSLSDISKNMSKSCIGLLNDMLNKPKSIHWFEYIQIILRKDQRYTYIGILLIIIAVYVLLVSH